MGSAPGWYAVYDYKTLYNVSYPLLVADRYCVREYRRCDTLLMLLYCMGNNASVPVFERIKIYTAKRSLCVEAATGLSCGNEEDSQLLIKIAGI